MSVEDYIKRVLDRLPPGTPTREQIATELRGHIAERVAAGQPLEEVLRQLGDPVALADSYLAAVPLVSAPFQLRVLAKLMDILVVMLVIAPVVGLLWLVWPSEHAAFFPVVLGMFFGAGTILFVAYTAISECVYGQTFGKRLFGIRVVRESGARIGGGQAIVRQLPMFLQMYWIDVLFALFTDRSQRAFELLSKTRVVLARRGEHCESGRAPAERPWTMSSSRS